MTGRAEGRAPAPGACLRSGARAILAAAALLTVAPLGADALRDAAEALQDGDFSAALPYLEEAVKDDPENVNARFNLAYALQSTGDSGGAIRHYRVIAEQQPDLLPARQNLAALLAQAGRFAAAAGEYEVLARMIPDDPAILRQLAAAHREAGDHGSASEAFRRLVAVEPESIDAVLGLAQSLDEAGRLHDAVPQYLRAAAIEPRYLEALPAAARRLEERGYREDAIELYRRYARARPRDAAAHEEIGILLLEEDRVRAALPALQRAVGLEPTFQRHAALAEAYRRSGNEGASHEQLGLAARAAPSNGSARLRYANSLLRQRQFDSAAREYVAAVDADSGITDAWNGLAFAMFQLGSFQASVRAIQESEQRGPIGPPTAYLKALSLDKLQQYEPARAAYEAFLAMRPAMPDEAWKAEQRLRTIEKVLSKR